ncbi:MAG TPA: TMEM165/GDT1 family protein [Syntrophales bacterium]|nr:TMEM165/GDT1 family protein [Syntrophales bacterium]HPX10842.1 TMEM165/GDT1 family protein [Syntrophales bacterium]HQB30702.1 TMEM165/GDT1 family protein [Syntrophales bacterium]HQN78890.1 TMEM165/GDT1 family protein [Syntrophales bacterium]HQQ26456.1 TMEM165/GDT1 family protein [Syntrophales bacterium]
MDFKLLFTVFSTIFVAEMADKTQIATFLYASNSVNSRLTVFLGSSLALIVASGLAVFFGAALSQWIDEKVMSKIAGAAFIAVGLWTLLK